MYSRIASACIDCMQLALLTSHCHVTVTVPVQLTASAFSQLSETWQSATWQFTVAGTEYLEQSD